MRKISTLLFIVLFPGMMILKAQSGFHAFDATSYVYGDTSLQNTHVKIVNTGTASKSIKVSQNNFSAVPGHVTYFCWGIVCYPPTVTVSIDPVVLNAGDTSTSFIGYLHPSGITGISEMTYNFFDENDESDSISVTFIYDITLTSITEVLPTASVSEAYPNPSSGLTSINYQVKNGGNASLVIYNALGSLVKESSIEGNNGFVILSTEGLPSGLYYYAIRTNGSITPARKLMVTKS